MKLITKYELFSLACLLSGILIGSILSVDAVYTPPPAAKAPTSGDNAVPWNTYNTVKSLEETNTHLKMLEIKLDQLIRIVNKTK